MSNNEVSPGTLLPEPFLRTIGMGAITGMRSMSSPAIVSHVMSEHRDPGFMGHPEVALLLKIAALGEMAADKHPSIPNRISIAPLLGRTALGGLTGYSLYTAAGHNALKGGVLGGLAAVAGTFASYYLRRFVTQHARVPGNLIGLVEDALVVAAGTTIIKR